MPSAACDRRSGAAIVSHAAAIARTTTMASGAHGLPSVSEAREWPSARGDGGGPFTSRLTWRLPGGGEATWESRLARKRGLISFRAEADGATATLPASVSVASRLRRVNWVAAAAFTVGGLLFAAGAAVAQLGSGEAALAASIYFAGGLFFNTGAYASMLGAINVPRIDTPGTALTAERWRWWSYEPQRIDWLSTFVLLVGTLAFAINLIDSFLDGLTTHEVNRLIWAPEVVGCVLFLISGHLAMTEICHRFRPCRRRRDLGWSIVVVNQVGSILFMVSALAALTRPETGSELNVDVANWGTLIGALCFAVGGVMQGFDRPATMST
jgi:hypothetical protein